MCSKYDDESLKCSAGRLHVRADGTFFGFVNMRNAGGGLVRATAAKY